MAQLSTIISANDARTNFYQILDEVSKNLRRFTITRRDGTRAVVMSEDEVDAWEETLDILSNKKLAKDLLEAKNDRKARRVYSLESIEKELKLNEN